MQKSRLVCLKSRVVCLVHVYAITFVPAPLPAALRVLDITRYEVSPSDRMIVAAERPLVDIVLGDLWRAHACETVRVNASGVLRAASTRVNWLVTAERCLAQRLREFGVLTSGWLMPLSMSVAHELVSHFDLNEILATKLILVVCEGLLEGAEPIKLESLVVRVFRFLGVDLVLLAFWSFLVLESGI